MRETRFANGGQVPITLDPMGDARGTPLKILRWMSQEDTPLLFRPRAAWLQWLLGMRFLFEFPPHRTRRNIGCTSMAGTARWAGPCPAAPARRSPTS